MGLFERDRERRRRSSTRRNGMSLSVWGPASASGKEISPTCRSVIVLAPAHDEPIDHTSGGPRSTRRLGGGARDERLPVAAVARKPAHADPSRRSANRANAGAGLVRAGGRTESVRRWPDRRDESPDPRRGDDTELLPDLRPAGDEAG